MGQCRSKHAAVAANDHDQPLMAKEQAEYYKKQCDVYLDTLAATLHPDEIPNLSENVLRWDWTRQELTSRNRDTLIAMDVFCTAMAPDRVTGRQHKIYQEQPLGRSKVQFESEDGSGGDVREMYMEFTFNEKGQISFVESWPVDTDQKCWWLQGSNRLSTLFMNNATDSRFRSLSSTANILNDGNGKHNNNYISQEVSTHDHHSKRIEAHQALEMELGRPLKQWFEGALERRLEEKRKGKDWPTVLQHLNEKRKAVEYAACIYEVDLLFPPSWDSHEQEDNNENLWKVASKNEGGSIQGAAIAEFASAAVRTLIFGSSEKIHRDPSIRK